MSKRKRQAVLFFTYGFMSLATLVISVFCIMLVLGYRFDVSHGRLEQGGLIQFRSNPPDASITVNNKRQSYQTPGKLEVPEGMHSVVMQKNGYHDWQKTVEVDAAEVRWLNFARLVPRTISTRTISEADGVYDTLPSPDRKYIAALSSEKPLTATIYDVRNVDNEIVKRDYQLPAELLSDEENTELPRLELVEWDFGARYIMLTSTRGDVVDYIRIDRAAEDGAPVNITREFNLPFRDMHFSGTSGTVFYAMTDKDLRKVDVGAQSVSQPLLSDIESYKLYHENDIAYVAKTAEKTLAGTYIDGKKRVAREYAANEKITVDITKYYREYYLAISLKNKVTLLKTPQRATAETKPFKEVSLPNEATWLDFASSGRFIVAGAGYAFTTYDLETDEKSVVSSDMMDAQYEPSWLDDYHFIDYQFGKLRMYEYDGQNLHDIVEAEPLSALVTENNEYILSFARKDDKIVLQASRMVLE